MFNNIHIIDGNKAKIEGPLMDNLLFVIKDQLKDVSMWRKFVEPFRTKEDRDNFWRGEFFGKQMRGVSLAYQVRQDEELYAILTDAAKDL